jgi:hypothetical protein
MSISSDALVISVVIVALASCSIADKLATPHDVQCLQAGGQWIARTVGPGHCERKPP